MVNGTAVELILKYFLVECYTASCFFLNFSRFIVLYNFLRNVDYWEFYYQTRNKIQFYSYQKGLRMHSFLNSSFLFFIFITIFKQNRQKKPWLRNTSKLNMTCRDLSLLRKVVTQHAFLFWFSCILRICWFIVKKHIVILLYWCMPFF